MTGIWQLQNDMDMATTGQGYDDYAIRLYDRDNYDDNSEMTGK